MIRPLLTALLVAACATASAATDAPAAPGTAIQGLVFDAETGQFTDAPPPDGGWQAFADLLQKAAPSTNTAVPLTPAEVSQRVSRLIDQGQARDALEVIELQEGARAQHDALGTDVQLLYQKGRAYDALGEHDQALAVWQQMTRDFPELPEPWNALAVEYARSGRLQSARQALETALASVPDFAPALENLGHVEMRLAQQAFERARAVRQNPSAAADATRGAQP